MKAWKKVLLGISIFIIALIAIIVGGLAYLNHYYNKKLENMALVVENLSDNSKVKLKNFENPLHCSFSPESGYIVGSVQSDSGYSIVIYSLSDSTIETVLTEQYMVIPSRWSVTGQGLFYFKHLKDKFWLWYYNAVEDKHMCLSPNTPLTITDASISPDERYLMFTEIGEKGYEQLYLMDLKDEQQYELETSGDQELQFPFWLDETRVVFLTESYLALFNITTGAYEKKISLPGLDNFSALFPDPNNSSIIYVKARMATGSFESQIYSVDLKKGTFSLWRENAPHFDMGHEISLDGTKLLYVSIEK